MNVLVKPNLELHSATKGTRNRMNESIGTMSGKFFIGESWIGSTASLTKVLLVHLMSMNGQQELISKDLIALATWCLLLSLMSPSHVLHKIATCIKIIIAIVAKPARCTVPTQNCQRLGAAQILMLVLPVTNEALAGFMQGLTNATRKAGLRLFSFSLNGNCVDNLKFRFNFYIWQFDKMKALDLVVLMDLTRL